MVDVTVTTPASHTKVLDTQTNVETDELQLKIESAAQSLDHQILGYFAYLGRYLHFHEGGRAGKTHILFTLVLHDGECTQKGLLSYLDGVSPAAISETLSKLEVEGLIVRTRSDNDKRQANVVLTSKGAARVQDLLHDKLMFERMSLSALHEEEKEQLFDYLKRIRATWEQFEEQKGEDICPEHK